MKFEAQLKIKFPNKLNLLYFPDSVSRNKIAPAKVKVLRFNNNAFMAKSLRKAIMLRSRLRNNFNKHGLMKTGTTIKRVFVLNYSARPKKNMLVILMSKVFLTTKNSGKP